MTDSVDPLHNVMAAAIAPPPRCYWRGENRLGQVCGELADWQRAGRDWFATSYFCDAHRGPADVAISPIHVFRRVRLSVDVLFFGASISAPIAHSEAMARLEAAVQSAGGLLDVQAVRSTVVKSSPQQPPRGAAGKLGDPG